MGLLLCWRTPTLFIPNSRVFSYALLGSAFFPPSQISFRTQLTFCPLEVFLYLLAPTPTFILHLNFTPFVFSLVFLHPPLFVFLLSPHFPSFPLLPVLLFYAYNYVYLIQCVSTSEKLQYDVSNRATHTKKNKQKEKRTKKEGRRKKLCTSTKTKRYT